MYIYHIALRIATRFRVALGVPGFGKYCMDAQFFSTSTTDNSYSYLVCPCHVRTRLSSLGKHMLPNLSRSRPATLQDQ
jgi:hypothetical protein